MRIVRNFYVNLIEDFLAKKISGKCFEYAYLMYFKNETREMSELEFPILNTLFLDVDEFCSDPSLIDKNDIGEEELRRRCKEALVKLKSIEDIASDRDEVPNIDVRVDLQSYFWLVGDYLYTNISTKCFCYIYSKTFKEEIGKMTDEENVVLSGLFQDIESFCKDSKLIINDQELRKQCKIALKTVEAIMKKQNFK